MSTFLDVLIGERRHAVKSKSDLVKALEDSKVRKSVNVYPNRASNRTTNNPSNAPGDDEHVFTPRKQKFFFLSNEDEGRRVIFTNDWFSAEKGAAPTDLKDILSLDQICKEWDTILSCFTHQLNDARAFITDRKNDPEDILHNITGITDKFYLLEIIHQYQSQWIKSLDRISWKENTFSGWYNARKRMDTIGKDISSRMNGFFQRSLFGMNVDILQKSPQSWTTYFYVAVPVFLLVMASVLAIKCRRKIAEIRYLVIDYGHKMAKLFEKAKVFDQEHGGRAVSQPLGSSPSTAEYITSRQLNEKYAYIELLYDLIKAGNTARGRRKTALQAAAREGHSEAMNVLLDAKADVNSQPAEYGERTALQSAAGSGRLNVVNRLLKVKADFNATPAIQGGRTGLKSAANSGHLDVVNRLLDVKADVFARSAETGGLTASQAAARNGYWDTVRRLLDTGADVNDLPTWMGKRLARSSSLCLAEVNGHVDVANILRANGAKEREQLVEEGARD
ncbi:Similar to Ankyrin repeat domain-containing protein 17; acc. no. O75179 [Pyronema omphalodes CBS 100304]|uniref:Similar to Ankyrin repeat domain-containing protein 17 acc. no. O75179 n=1 Tax=Pyronema omphalodes (strain CBS 100304) TaxID=1076935 RepID=U4LAI4_PYROM|nr:Similar to Ankyrin repeat domain-containing protein 17; acc. no. O75179 [Pyronema omphalodes CBS 100304]